MGPVKVVPRRSLSLYFGCKIIESKLLKRYPMNIFCSLKLLYGVLNLAKLLVLDLEQILRDVIYERPLSNLTLFLEFLENIKGMLLR